MQAKVIDLIIKMVRMIQLGQNIKDIKPEDFTPYSKSEVSAAYSWVIQKVEDNSLAKQDKRNKNNARVLHAAERMIISTEAQGYLIELYNMGVINFSQMENIIEQTMINNFEKVTLEKIKSMVSNELFGDSKKQNLGGMYLHGTESIN
jgi:uncharacterized protein Smg (DUF494 family)